MPRAEGVSDLVTGVDIQSDDECRESLETFGQRYIDALFAEEELRQGAFSSSPRWIAGRFAAKEAVFKTLRASPDQAIPWPDIRILATENGWLTVNLQGAALAAAASRGLSHTSVSISHASGFSCAVAVSYGAAHSRDPEQATGHQVMFPFRGST